jgi:hypothetical protein
VVGVYSLELKVNINIYFRLGTFFFFLYRPLDYKFSGFLFKEDREEKSNLEFKGHLKGQQWNSVEKLS